MKIVITDCDHASVDIEREVVESAGYELVLNQSMEPDEIVRGAAGADGLIVQYGRITAEVFAGLRERVAGHVRGHHDLSLIHI